MIIAERCVKLNDNRVPLTKAGGENIVCSSGFSVLSA